MRISSLERVHPADAIESQRRAVDIDVRVGGIILPGRPDASLNHRALRLGPIPRLAASSGSARSGSASIPRRYCRTAYLDISGAEEDPGIKDAGLRRAARLGADLEQHGRQVVLALLQEGVGEAELETGVLGCERKRSGETPPPLVRETLGPGVPRPGRDEAGRSRVKA